jgi:3-dehydroquinate synthase class II
MVKQVYQNAINQLASEKDRQVALVKERVTREVIIPHNNEVNQSRDKAIAELTATLNAEIAKLQQKFAVEKQALIDVGEKNKAEFAENTLATESAIVSAKYDGAIHELEALIAKIKE